MTDIRSFFGKPKRTHSSSSNATEETKVKQKSNRTKENETEVLAEETIQSAATSKKERKIKKQKSTVSPTKASPKHDDMKPEKRRRHHSKKKDADSLEKSTLPNSRDNASKQKSPKAKKGFSRTYSSEMRTTRKRAAVIIEDDEDASNESSTKKSKISPPVPVSFARKKMSYIDSDSDTETEQPYEMLSPSKPSPDKNIIEQSFKEQRKIERRSPRKHKASLRKQEVKEVAPSDYFSTTPSKRKSASNSWEKDAHADSAFHQALDQGDVISLISPTGKPGLDTSKSLGRSSAVKHSSDSTVSPSLSAKLAAKVRTANTTPVTPPKPSRSSPKAPSKSPAVSKSPIASKSPTKTTPKRSKKSPDSKQSSSASTKAANLNTSSSIPATTTTTPRGSASAYRAYMQREGPRALNSRPIPEGKPDCFTGLTFVITGVLDCIERDDAQALIERYGGRVTKTVSKKTTYVIAGREPGPSKIDKAESLNIKQLDEDGLFDLISSLPAGKTPKGKQSKKPNRAQNKPVVKTDSKDIENDDVTVLSTTGVAPNKSAVSTPNISSATTSSPLRSTMFSATSEKIGSNEKRSQEAHLPKRRLTKILPSPDGLHELWVEKYRPRQLSELVGQQGDRSCARKLLNWLKNWHKNFSGGSNKPKPNFFRGKEDGSIFKAALLSGPPGVGKTTTAQVVCKEAGYTFVEMNASDTRNKKSLQTELADAVNSTKLSSFSSIDLRSHCLIMDEVDGMSGNEDRGGMQELIHLIKISKIPIICICNDRNHQKIRSLAFSCFDLRFNRPRSDQIKTAMLNICNQEDLNIEPSCLDGIIETSNHDLRQVFSIAVIHQLEIWRAGATTKDLTPEQAKKDAFGAKKDLKLV